MAVTRIKNNQITDSTITYQKIASGTLVGSLFNANLTFNSNISIAGNLTVTGNTTTVSSIDTLVADSLITLNNGYVGVPAYDVGILFNRALGSLGNYGSVNAALVWSESDGAFIAVLTTETGTTAGTINRAFQANMIVGNLTVSNAVTAQTATVTTLNVTNANFSGLTSTGNIVAASGTNATNYTTGALVVPGGGGVGITGDLWVQGPSTFAGNIVAGNIQLSGNINVPVGGTFSNTGVFFGNAGGIGALYAGTTTYTALPTTVLQLSGNVDTYAQVNFQNINAGTKASTDFVLTADNGTDTDGFIDLGINSSTFADANYPGFYPNDGYLVHHSALSTGNLVIFSHTDGSAIKLHVGDYGDANVKVTVTNNGLTVNTSTASTSTTSGALLVNGGLGVAGNIHAAAINNTPIGNTVPNTGNFTTVTANNSSTTTAVATNLSTGNIVITGGYAQGLANVNASNGNIITLVADNFSTGNAVITGGGVNNTPIGNTTPSTGNFTTANATTFTGYTATVTTVNSTSGNINTIDASITTTTTLNSSDANLSYITAGETKTALLNSTSGNLTTLVANNFSTGNAIISGGNINLNTGSSYIQASYINSTYSNVANFIATNASISSGDITANLNSNSVNFTGGTINNTAIGLTTPSAGNFTNANATQFTGYNATLAVINSTSGNITNLTATNFNTANATITGGYADNFKIGPNTAATGAFTTLTTSADYTATGNVIVTNSTESTSASTGALRVTGGVGIGGNLFVAGNLTVQGNTTVLNTETLNVEDLNITVAANASTASEADGAGLTVQGAGATFTYVNAIDSWQLNKNLYGIDTTMVNANITTANLTSAAIGTLIVTNPTTFTTLNITNGNVTTLVATNFSSGNTQITGGYADNYPIGANTAATGNFTTANATTFTGYTLNGTTLNATNGNITTLTSPTVNAGSATVATLNSTVGNITTGNIDTLNTAAGNITTLVATNFGSANAVITGGSVNNTPIGATTPNTGNFTTANATTIEAYTVTGTTVNTTNGNVTTLAATNFSTANARITGGYADNFPIGANTAAPGYFTNLDASNSTKTAILNVTANVYLSPQSAPGTVTINPLTSGTIDNMTIGATSAANVYASNFRAATSLWAATTGPVWIRGGTGTSGINNIPIGAVTPSTGAFTTADIATGSITTLNNFTGNVTTLFATNFNTANAVISGGYISALTNAYVTTSLITNFSTANARITGGYADNYPIGANTAATGAFTTLTAASLNNTIIGNSTPAAGTFTTLTATTSLTAAGNLVLSSDTTTVYTDAAGTANTTGALIITGTGGAAVNGNVYIGQGAVINGNQTTYDTIVRGVNERSLLTVYADSTYDQVSIGGNLTTANVTQGAKLVVNSTDAMIIPKGTSAQRPGAAGYTDVTGMIRYNLSTNELEYYGVTGWKNTGSTFTVIASRTFSNSSGDINGNVDGSNTQFTLGSDSSTAATLISINGVVQIPATAYSVSGNVVTFTEAPAIGDVIDTRVITTTSTVVGLSSLDGYNQFTADTTGLRFYTGNLSLGSVENWRIDNWGDLLPITSSNIGSANKRVDYIYASNINLSGGSITGATVSSGSLDDTVIGGNIARSGSFTTLYSNSTFTTNAEHVTDDIRGKYVAPSATDAVYGFATATYRSGKFFVQLSSASEYQAAEVIAIHNGTTCSIEVYGVTFTGAANLATFSCNIAGGTAYLNASSAGANLAIKVTPTLMKI